MHYFTINIRIYQSKEEGKVMSTSTFKNVSIVLYMTVSHFLAFYLIIFKFSSK